MSRTGTLVRMSRIAVRAYQEPEKCAPSSLPGDVAECLLINPPADLKARGEWRGFFFDGVVDARNAESSHNRSVDLSLVGCFYELAFYS